MTPTPAKPQACWLGDRDILAVPEEQMFSPAEVYHENSKIHLTDLDFAARVLQVNGSPEIRRVISNPDSSFPGHPGVPLSGGGRETGMDLTEALKRRRSCRAFTGAGIELSVLGDLLWQGAGFVVGQTHEDGTTWSLRTAPSGGGLYPVDQYCVALNVDGLAAGLYYHHPEGHRLERVREGDFRDELGRATHLDGVAHRASACILLAGVLPRIAFKYGQRGYRFLLLEAGHIAQNLLLGATALNLGSLAVGGFADDPVNRLLGLDGVGEFAVYLVFVGHAAGTEPVSP